MFLSNSKQHDTFQVSYLKYIRHIKLVITTEVPQLTPLIYLLENHMVVVKDFFFSNSPHFNSNMSFMSTAICSNSHWIEVITLLCQFPLRDFIFYSIGIIGVFVHQRDISKISEKAVNFFWSELSCGFFLNFSNSDVNFLMWS